MAHPTLHKFPRTIHLLNTGAATRDDLVVSASDVQHWLQRELVCEEKVDGGNLGISFDENWAVRLQKRGHWVTPASEPQYAKLQSWLDVHRQELCGILGQDRILFGEWLYAQHTVVYDRLPDWFLAFDIYDITEGKFYSRAQRERMLAGSSLWSVQHIVTQHFQNVQDTLALLEGLQSVYSTQGVPAEGLVLRAEEGPWLVQRLKVVRAGFQQAIEEGDHWSKRTLLPNTVRADLWPEPDRADAVEEEGAGTSAAGLEGAQPEAATLTAEREAPETSSSAAEACASSATTYVHVPPARQPEGVQLCWVRGVIAVAGPAVDAAAQSALQLFDEDVAEEARQRQRERDGPHHHITLLAPAEAKQIMDEQGMGRTALLEVVRGMVDPAGWLPLALGHCSDAAAGDPSPPTADYLIVTWPSACLARQALGLQPYKHFHVTLGFQPRDVHSQPKDWRSAVHPPDSHHIRSMTAVAAAAGMGLQLPQEAALLLLLAAWQLCTSAPYEEFLEPIVERLLAAALHLLEEAPPCWLAVAQGCAMLLRARLLGRTGELQQCEQQASEGCRILDGSCNTAPGHIHAALSYGHQLAAKALYTQGDYGGAEREFAAACSALKACTDRPPSQQTPVLPADILQHLMSMDLNVDTMAKGKQAAAKKLQEKNTSKVQNGKTVQ